MSFSGGTFSINTSGQPVVSGTTISSTVFNALTADLATGLSTCVLKDGTQVATAAVPFAAGISIGGGPTLSSYLSGSFNGTLTGGTTSPSVVVKYLLIGGIAVVTVPAFSVTSNAITKTITGVNVNVTPATNSTYFTVGMQDNSGTVVPGRVIMLSTGVIAMYPSFATNNWTASGGMQSNEFTLIYDMRGAS